MTHYGVRKAACTELHSIKNLILGKIVLVVLVAKHPIFYLASLFCYVPFYAIIHVRVKAKVKLMLNHIKKK